jgi:type IV pilus assembly protein PilQ
VASTINASIKTCLVFTSISLITASIIVRGHEPDLDTIDAVIREIDVKTKQVLIEAFIVEAESEFEQALGTKLGGGYNRKGKRVGGSTGSAISTDYGSTTQSLDGSNLLSNFPTIGATKFIFI